jgi:H+/Cl- antiporter ClcA
MAAKTQNEMSSSKNIRAQIHSIVGQDLPGRVSRAGRWTLYFIGIGLIAGTGAVIFHYLCQVGIHFFMDMLAGYRPPAPAGEHHLLPATTREFNRWILLFLPAFGGILSGWHRAEGMRCKEGPQTTIRDPQLTTCIQ